jgi:hypothetical protein
MARTTGMHGNVDLAASDHRDEQRPKLPIHDGLPSLWFPAQRDLSQGQSISPSGSSSFVIKWTTVIMVRRPTAKLLTTADTWHTEEIITFLNLPDLSFRTCSMVSFESFRDSLRKADDTEDVCHDRGIVHHNLRFFSGALHRTVHAVWTPGSLRDFSRVSGHSDGMSTFCTRSRGSKLPSTSHALIFFMQHVCFPDVWLAPMSA